MIDNFDIVRDNLLKFDKQGEFYMILVLRRRKDVKGSVVEGVNEDNSLIKHYFVYDKEYYDKKRQAIINLCEQNNARAYILPQRRTCELVLWNLHDTISDTLKKGSMNVHFDHLIRSSVAGMHETPPDAKWHKRWVIDLDENEYDQSEIGKGLVQEGNPPMSLGMFACYIRMRLVSALVGIEGCRCGDAIAFMPNASDRYDKNDITVLKTPHGFHIVTPPFNREPNAMGEYFSSAIPSSWIKPDAMAMLYAPDTI